MTVFNIDAALIIVSGDETLLKELITLFLTTVDEYTTNIQAAINSEDSEEVMKTAHKFKGAVGNFGECKLFHIAKILERFGKESNLEKAKPVFEELLEEASEFKKALNEFVKR